MTDPDNLYQIIRKNQEEIQKASSPPRIIIYRLGPKILVKAVKDISDNRYHTLLSESFTTEKKAVAYSEELSILYPDAPVENRL